MIDSLENQQEKIVMPQLDKPLSVVIDRDHWNRGPGCYPMLMPRDAQQIADREDVLGAIARALGVHPQRLYHQPWPWGSRELFSAFRDGLNISTWRLIQACRQLARIERKDTEDAWREWMLISAADALLNVRLSFIN